MSSVPGAAAPIDLGPRSRGVELVYWNPVRRRFTGPLSRVPLVRPVDNFGDRLAPIVVEHLRAADGATAAAAAPARLLGLGSILHLARDGDTVWGSGLNGKVASERHSFARLDVRAVRGPLTHAFLRRRGIADRELPYGDPALLMAHVRPDLVGVSRRFAVTVMQNINDPWPTGRRDALSPRRPVEVCLQRIARSRLVVGSCLHAIIVAEALGIPARAVRSGAEPELKYADYYLGTGRAGLSPAPSIEAAIAAGGAPPPAWDPEPLLAAFPHDLWRPRAAD